MQTFKAYSGMYTSGMRTRDTLNIASNDVNVRWQFTFSDQNPQNDVVDPLTNRAVDKVSWSQYTMANDAPPGTEYDEEIGHDATISYDSNFPYANLVIDVPNKLRIEQDGPAFKHVIDGVVDSHWTIHFNVVIL